MKSKKLLIGLAFLIAATAYAVDIKISQLPLGSASTSAGGDSFPYVSAGVNTTKRLTLWDLSNIPTIVSTYAPKASPVFTGTVTAPTFIGALTGNATTATALAADPTDCSANQFANAIAANGNLTCAAVPSSSLSGVLPVAKGGTNSGTTLSNSKTMVSSGGAIVESVVTSTELGNLVGTTSAIQTQLNAKQATGNYITALTGDVVATGPGSVSGTIQSGVVSNAKLATVAANSIKGNNTGSTAAPIDLTATQTTAMLNAMVGDTGSGGTKGLAPAPASGDAAANKFLKADGTWTAPSGSSKSYWGGYHDNTCFWVGNAGSFADPSPDATCALVQTKNSGFGTVTTYNSGGNALPGINFTVPATGIYFVSAILMWDNSSTNAQGWLSLTDGTTVISQVYTQFYPASQEGIVTPISGLWSGTGGASVTIKLQVATASTNANLRSSAPTRSTLEWTIFQL